MNSTQPDMSITRNNTIQVPRKYPCSDIRSLSRVVACPVIPLRPPCIRVLPTHSQHLMLIDLQYSNRLTLVVLPCSQGPPCLRPMTAQLCTRRTSRYLAAHLRFLGRDTNHIRYP